MVPLPVMVFAAAKRCYCREMVFSLQSYFYNDDAFNFNYAQAKAALGSYQEAEEVVVIPQTSAWCS